VNPSGYIFQLPIAEYVPFCTTRLAQPQELEDEMKPWKQDDWVSGGNAA
jgi:hypothetical protein